MPMPWEKKSRASPRACGNDAQRSIGPRARTPYRKPQTTLRHPLPDGAGNAGDGLTLREIAGELASDGIRTRRAQYFATCLFDEAPRVGLSSDAARSLVPAGLGV